jgi:hypothetical protein
VVLVDEPAYAIGLRGFQQVQRSGNVSVYKVLSAMGRYMWRMEVGGMDDGIHIFCDAPDKVSIGKVPV